MTTENPNNFPMPERYLQMYPLHCHIADEFIKGLWAHPGQAPSSAPASTIKVQRLSEAASSMAVALPRRRQRDRRTERRARRIVERSLCYLKKEEPWLIQY